MHKLDPYRAATVLIKQMGPDAAEDHARARHLDLLGEHDDAGVAAWIRVRAAICELSRTQPKPGETRRYVTAIAPGLVAPGARPLMPADIRVDIRQAPGSNVIATANMLPR